MYLQIRILKFYLSEAWGRARHWRSQILARHGPTQKGLAFFFLISEHGVPGCPITNTKQKPRSRTWVYITLTNVPDDSEAQQGLSTTASGKKRRHPDSPWPLILPQKSDHALWNAETWGGDRIWCSFSIFSRAAICLFSCLVPDSSAPWQGRVRFAGVEPPTDRHESLPENVPCSGALPAFLPRCTW